jgi:mono/diheme cytochrome c family protein
MLLRLLAVGLVLLLAGCSSDGYRVGGDLYEQSCAICHANDGSGGIGPAINGGSNTDLALSDEQIAGVITVGPGNMPGFGRFTAEQVDSLVAYVRAFADD